MCRGNVAAIGYSSIKQVFTQNTKVHAQNRLMHIGKWEYVVEFGLILQHQSFCNILCSHSEHFLCAFALVRRQLYSDGYKML